MDLSKYFSIFGLGVSLSKNIFIFKCGCLSGSNNLNLHLEIAFSEKSRTWKNFKIFCASVLTIVLYVTLKQVFSSHSFSRCNSETLIRTLKFTCSVNVIPATFQTLFSTLVLTLCILSQALHCQNHLKTAQIPQRLL